MLEKPDLNEALLAQSVEKAYGIVATKLEFLPLGADYDTAVYRVHELDGGTYFLKLRRGELFQPALIVPRMLADRVPGTVIPPIVLADGALSIKFDEFSLSMYPFVAGVDGFQSSLNRAQWSAVASLLRGLHSLPVPTDVQAALPVETFADTARSEVRSILTRLDALTPPDTYAAALMDSLRERQPVIEHLVDRASQISLVLNRRQLPLVLCHGDIHAGNVLIDAEGNLMVVDWDTLVLAPRERDLMFIGAGIGDTWRTEWESATFYAIYGRAATDQHAIAYFRMERVIEDVRAFSEQLLNDAQGGEDRAQALRYFNSQFEPGGVLDIALNSDPEA